EDASAAPFAGLENNDLVVPVPQRPRGSQPGKTRADNNYPFTQHRYAFYVPLRRPRQKRTPRRYALSSVFSSFFWFIVEAGVEGSSRTFSMPSISRCTRSTSLLIGVKSKFPVEGGLDRTRTACPIPDSCGLLR